LETPASESLRRDVRVIGLVGVAHAFSHFFQLALPPLFPFLRGDFDASWTLLGALVGVFYATSGLTQFVAGFAVDRFGARPVLLGGLALLAGGTALASLVPGVYWLFPVVVLMGLGNGVFHPCDFAILNANVAPRRLGHAYSTHGVGGSLGYALSPVVSFALASAFNWRVALAVMGLVGLAALAMLASQRTFLTSQRASEGHAHGLGLFLRPAILLCFAFFAIQTTASIALQTFLPAGLNTGFEVALPLATSAVTAYLLGATSGIVAGGFLAARTTRHDLVAAGGLLAGASMLAVIGAGGITPGSILPTFALVGFLIGCTGPSRDLIVLYATPKGATGRVYGFVYSGLDLGATIAPVWFGFMLDHGQGREMFYVIAALLTLAVATVVRVRRAVATA
jgi:MFS family permease